jgi:hypothetical protein
MKLRALVLLLVLIGCVLPVGALEIVEPATERYVDDVLAYGDAVFAAPDWYVIDAVETLNGSNTAVHWSRRAGGILVQIIRYDFSVTDITRPERWIRSAEFWDVIYRDYREYEHLETCQIGELEILNTRGIQVREQQELEFTMRTWFYETEPHVYWVIMMNAGSVELLDAYAAQAFPNAPNCED